MITRRRSLRTDTSGFSLVELLVALGITGLIMGTTMVALSDAVRANETVTMITGMNSMLRASMDLMVLDLMQGGNGLPSAHTVEIPSGAQAQPILLPGPPGSSFTSGGSVNLAAVVPGTGLGPVINGVATDTITLLMADNDWFGIEVKNVTPTSVDAKDPIDFEDPPYRVAPGQLVMVWSKTGNCSTLVQVTNVLNNGKIMFSANDSMKLNQPQAKDGSLSALKDCGTDALIARIRMVSYYLDATTNPNRPRLVRRINNGDPATFNNELGTAVGLDIENLQLSYDLVVGNAIRPNIRFAGADLAAGGTCGTPCSPTQIRKVNVALTARSKNAAFTNNIARVHRNTLTSQVSLRGMAFGNKYVQ